MRRVGTIGAMMALAGAAAAARPLNSSGPPTQRLPHNQTPVRHWPPHSPLSGLANPKLPPLVASPKEAPQRLGASLAQAPLKGALIDYFRENSGRKCPETPRALAPLYWTLRQFAVDKDNKTKTAELRTLLKECGIPVPFLDVCPVVGSGAPERAYDLCADKKFKSRHGVDGWRLDTLVRVLNNWDGCQYHDYPGALPLAFTSDVDATSEML